MQLPLSHLSHIILYLKWSKATHLYMKGSLVYAVVQYWTSSLEGSRNVLLTICGSQYLRKAGQSYVTVKEQRETYRKRFMKS